MKKIIMYWIKNPQVPRNEKIMTTKISKNCESSKILKNKWFSKIIIEMFEDLKKQEIRNILYDP